MCATTVLQESASVLVVDDNRAMSKMIRYNLEDEHTEVIEADASLNSMTALNRKVDVILVALRLPIVSEWSILSDLRSINTLRNIPIIVIAPEPPRRSLIRQFQPDEFIQAPFDVRDLLLRVRKYIRQGKTRVVSRTEELVN